MICSEIIKIIERDFPKEYALEWDNIGLLAGRAQKEVNSIYIALDATDEVIEEAAAIEADMMITHHPLIFSPIKHVSDADFITRRLVDLIQNDISYYAIHTNYDVLRMGQLAGQKLGLTHTAVLDITHSDETGNRGIGVVAQLDTPVTLAGYCKRVKRSFSLETVKVFGDLHREVSRIAVSPGSGKHMTEAAIKVNADVLITGDIDHHEGIDANAREVAIIDAGHYGLEYIFIEDIRMYIEGRFPGIEVMTAPIHHPFRIV